MAELFVLRTLAVINSSQDLDVQHNETPELIGFEFHPKFISRCDLHVSLLILVLFGNDLPAWQGFEFPYKSVMEHEFHPRPRQTHFHVTDKQIPS